MHLLLYHIAYFIFLVVGGFNSEYVIWSMLFNAILNMDAVLGTSSLPLLLTCDQAKLTLGFFYQNLVQ